jgi:sugar lactone lactonase YvrE
MAPQGTNWWVTTIAGLPGAPGTNDGMNTDARFNRPAGIAIDSAGNLFVAERYNHTIREITPSGTNWVVSTVAGTAGITGQNDGTNTQAQFYLPSGIAIDESNHIYVADTANFTVREIVPIGTNWVVTTIAGTALNFGFADGINFQAQFNYPYGIAVSSSGKLYIADWGNNAIREMTRSGVDWAVGTIAGFSGKPGTADGAGSFAAFNSPTGVAVDSLGALYVADQNNNSIRKIVPSTPGWSVSTLAGQALHSGSADGIGTNALFKKPWGIAVGAAGALFVADYGNSTIREGIPASVPVPDLQILLADGQVVLAWPAWASNYVLETSAILTTANSWIPVTNGITLAGEAFVLTNQVDAGPGFYRLR